MNAIKFIMDPVETIGNILEAFRKNIDFLNFLDFLVSILDLSLRKAPYMAHSQPSRINEQLH